MKKVLCAFALWILCHVVNAATLQDVEKTIASFEPGLVTGFVFKDEGELAYLSAQDGVMHVSPMVLYLPVEVVEFILQHEYAHAVFKHNDQISAFESNQNSKDAGCVKALRFSIEYMADEYAVSQLLAKKLTIAPVIEFFDRLNMDETLSHPSAQKRIEHIQKMINS